MGLVSRSRATVALTAGFIGALVVVPTAIWLHPAADAPTEDEKAPATVRTSSTASATPTPTPTPTPATAATSPTIDAPAAATMETGRVRANDAVADLQGAVAFGEDQSLDGGVAAFTSAATWLLVSPAARNEPMSAVKGPLGSNLNMADAQLLIAMGRTAGDDFTPSAGVYRVVGHSGAESSPDQVMVEVAAPASLGGRTRWLIVGGVVVWADGHWNLASIAPHEIPQPPTTIRHASELSAEQQATTFPGLGWQYFAPAS